MRLSERLQGLERIGQVNSHVASVVEIQQHLVDARDFLSDASRKGNTLRGRFGNANSAAHSFLMAAIKMHGYRPTGEKGHRYILYELLDALLPAAAGAKAVLSQAHKLRNRSEYDGDPIDVTQGLVEDLVSAAANVQEEVALMFKSFKLRHQTLQEIPAKSPTQRPKSSNGKPTIPGRKR